MQLAGKGQGQGGRWSTALEVCPSDCPRRSTDQRPGADLGPWQTSFSISQQFSPKPAHKTASGSSEVLELPERIGGPSRTRTLDPLIKSTSQRVQAEHTDELNAHLLDLFSDSQ